jgi:hypothetical protein
MSKSKFAKRVFLPVAFNLKGGEKAGSALGPPPPHPASQTSAVSTQRKLAYRPDGAGESSWLLVCPAAVCSRGMSQLLQCVKFQRGVYFHVHVHVNVHVHVHDHVQVHFRFMSISSSCPCPCPCSCSCSCPCSCSCTCSCSCSTTV